MCLCNFSLSFYCFFPCSSTFSAAFEELHNLRHLFPQEGLKTLNLALLFKSAVHKRERERERERESNAGFYLRQIFNLNFFAVLKQKTKFFLLLFSKENMRSRTFMIRNSNGFYFQRIIRNNLERKRKYF